jgi:translation initiation factor IF-2
MVIGFNVSASKHVQSQAGLSGVPLHLETVIYRLIETVRAKPAALLPPRIESKTTGEASVLQLFPINLKKKQTLVVAGGRVGNGVIKKTDGVRVLRGPERIKVYEGERFRWPLREESSSIGIASGTIETLKHLKKDVTEIRKGMECGIGFKDFNDIQEGDEIINFTTFEVPREL